MKPKINVALLIVCVIAAFALTQWLDRAAPPRATSLQDGPALAIAARDAAPDFSFTDQRGDNLNLSDFRGKYIILHFWASYCGPCVVEFPDLIKSTAARGKDITLIAVSSDTSESALDAFLLRQKPEVRKMSSAPNIFITRDHKGQITNDLYQTYRLPETIIINADLTIREKIVGATDWSRRIDQIIPPTR